MLHRLRRELPDKHFIPGPTDHCACADCRYMKMNTLEKLRDALANLAPEYERRVQSEGQAIADEWLAETARAIGQRDGEGARRLVGQLNVVRNAAQQDAPSV